MKRLIACLFLTVTSAAVMATDIPSPVQFTGPIGLQTTTSFTVSWNPPPEGATGYTVVITNWFNNTQVLNTTTTATSVSCPTDFVITDNQSYTASVYATNSAGSGDWSSLNIDVCSLGLPTDAPVVTEPVNNGFSGTPHIGLDVTFQWNRVNNAARYWIAVMDWQVTTWPMVFNQVLVDPGSGTSVSCGPVTLQEGHVYCVEVIASNPAGPGPYSDPVYFGVSTASGTPPATSFTLPPPQALDYNSIPYYTPRIDTTGVVFEWPKTEKTIGYNFMLVEVDPEYHYLGLWWIPDDGTTNPAQFILPPEITLKDGCRYERWVDGFNPWGLGAWTVDNFIPGDPPPLTGPTLSTTITEPVGTTPVGLNDIYDRRPTLSVYQVPRTTQYVWYINDSSQGWATTWFVEPATPGPQSSYTLTWAQALTPGVLYSVLVRAHNLLGDSDFSEAVYWTVTPVPLQTTWVGPLGSTQIADLTQTTLAWANQEHVLSWNLDMYDAFSGSHVWQGTIPTSIDGNGHVTCQLHLQEHQYIGNVMGQNNSGSADWATNNFSVSVLPGGPAKPTVTYPVAGIPVATTRPTLEWASVTGAGQYQVYLYDGADLIINQGLVLTDGEPHSLAYGTGTYTSELTVGHTYSLTVGAVNGYGWGVASYSDPLVFTVGPPQTAPTIISPLGYDNVINPTFDWTSVPGADHYWLTVTDTTVPGTAFDGQVNSVPAAPTSLPAGHSFHGAVKAQNALGDGPVAEWDFGVSAQGGLGVAIHVTIRP